MNFLVNSSLPLELYLSKSLSVLCLRVLVLSTISIMCSFLAKNLMVKFGRCQLVSEQNIGNGGKF
jgi:hypothetical protein